MHTYKKATATAAAACVYTTAYHEHNVADGHDISCMYQLFNNFTSRQVTLWSIEGGLKED